MSEEETKVVAADTADGSKTLSKKERKALEFRQKLESKKNKVKKQDGEEPAKKESKKRKRDETGDKTELDDKDKKKQEQEAAAAAAAAKSASTEKKEGASKPKKRKKKSKNGGESGGARFILFVGNLPFKYNLAELEEHLKPCSPDTIRPRDNKGFAFVEFAGDDASRRLTIALSKLHHSTFMGRKINVELTAGGGGNTDTRKLKIREKNAKLEETRKADMEKEKAEKLEKEKRKHTKFGADGAANSDGVSGSNNVPLGGGAPKDENAGLHPSRRRLLKGGK